MRECYDAVRAILGPAADKSELSSMGDVSTAALGHEDAMYRLAGHLAGTDDLRAGHSPPLAEAPPPCVMEAG